MWPLQRGHRFSHVVRIQFDADVAPSQSLGHDPDRPGAEERIKHEIARTGRGKHTRLDQCLRKGSDMGTAGITRVDVPNGAPIAGVSILGGFFHCFLIVVIIPGFGQHEEIFMRPGWPILDAFRHDIGFVPHDVTAQKPAVVLQGEGKPPRDAEQILVLETGRIVRTHVHRAIRILLVGRSPAPIAAGVAVANIEPENAVRSEDPFHFGEYIGQSLDEARESRLESDLSCNTVVPQTPVGWRRDHALHGFAGQPAQGKLHITFEHD